MAISLIRGMRKHRYTGRNQLWSGSCNFETPSNFRGRSMCPLELDVVEVPRHLAVLDLRLGDRGLVDPVPLRRRDLAVDVALVVEVDEAGLTDRTAALVDRRVVLLPVAGQREALPQRDELLLVLHRGCLAHRDEL